MPESNTKRYPYDIVPQTSMKENADLPAGPICYLLSAHQGINFTVGVVYTSQENSGL